MIDQLTVPALHEYLIAVLGERWPDQLLLKYGVDRCSPNAHAQGYGFRGPCLLRKERNPHTRGLPPLAA